MLADSPDTEDSEARSVDTRGDGRRHSGDDDDDTNVVDDVTNVASVFHCSKKFSVQQLLKLNENKTIKNFWADGGSDGLTEKKNQQHWGHSSRVGFGPNLTWTWTWFIPQLGIAILINEFKPEKL